MSHSPFEFKPGTDEIFQNLIDELFVCVTSVGNWIGGWALFKLGWFTWFNQRTIPNKGFLQILSSCFRLFLAAKSKVDDHGQ